MCKPAGTFTREKGVHYGLKDASGHLQRQRHTFSETLLRPGSNGWKTGQALPRGIWVGGESAAERPRQGPNQYVQ